MMKFCLLTLGPKTKNGAEFVFFATNVDHLADERRRFTLSPDDMRRINPNTRTMPVFRSKADADLARKIYGRVPVLIDDSKGDEGNPWGVRFMAMFHMANDSPLFRTAAQLTDAGARCEGVKWLHADGTVYTPLYEAKMIHQFDHRWATFDPRPGQFRDVTTEEKKEPGFEATPRYWVPEAEVEERLRQVGWDRGWLMGWRDITNVTNQRTVIATIFSKMGVGHSLPLFILPHHAPELLIALLANLNSIPLDYVARQKVGGSHLTYAYLEQLPILAPETYERSDLDFIVPRTLELTYTSKTMKPLVQDVGYNGPPFAFDPERRAILRAELDAYCAKLYG